MSQTLYCDGGVIGRNPSDIGGVWAWCLVDTLGALTMRRGFLVPPTANQFAHNAILFAVEQQLMGTDIHIEHFPGSESVAGRCSNNHTELYAMLDGMEHLPDGWEGSIVSDSIVTLRRMRGESLLDPSQVPLALIERVGRANRRLGRVEFLHVKGHPSKAAMKAGYIGDHPVSKHQVWCDHECVRIRDLALRRYRSLQASQALLRRLVTP
jgi:ribonuclease HI